MTPMREALIDQLQKTVAKPAAAVALAVAGEELDALVTGPSSSATAPAARRRAGRPRRSRSRRA